MGNNFGIFRELGQRKKTKTKQIDYNRIQICSPSSYTRDIQTDSRITTVLSTKSLTEIVFSYVSLFSFLIFMQIRCSHCGPQL